MYNSAKSGHSAGGTSIEWETVGNMKRLLLLLCPLLLLSACGGADRNGVETFQELRNVELTVFADSSLSGICETLAVRYRDAYPGIRLRFQFGSSAALLGRVREGAACDLFVSASDAVMDALDGGGFLSVRRESHAPFRNLPRLFTDERPFAPRFS